MSRFALFVAITLAVAATALLVAWIAGRDVAIDDGTGPQLLYLAMLAGLTASGVLFAARHNVGKAIRDAAVWAGIVLLLVLAYSYRGEASDLWGRIRGELFLGTPVQTADGRVEIRRSPDAHFYVDAEVDGARVRFMIDTGASTVALSWEDARAAGIDPAALTFNVPVQTAAGPSAGAAVRVERLAVGPIERRDVEAMVMPRGVPVSLLGLSFLDTLSGYEIRRDLLTLRD